MIYRIEFLFYYLKSMFGFLVVTGCDITLTVTNTTQYVGTKGFPHRYQNGQACDYNFVAPPGRRTIVMFEDIALERYDYIQFRKLHVTREQKVTFTTTFKFETSDKH